MRSLFSTALCSAVLFLAGTHNALAVNIAIMDTGLNPGVLGGVTNFGLSRDFVNNDNDASDDGFNQHGTAVGFIAATTGQRITLTGIKIFGPNFETNPGILEAAFNYVAGLSEPRVVNISGSQVSNTPLESLQAVAASNKVLVFQAGNQAGVNPAGDALKVDRIPNSIIVGGATPDGSDIQSFSNRAGIYRDFYVLQQTNSLITDSNGTSMAAPRVSAQAATIMDQFGFLTPGQVVQLIFETATDLGEPGPDQVYGHGVANLEASLRAAGEGNIPTDPGGSGGSSGGGGSGLGIAALALGGIAAYVLTNKDEELQSTVLVDKFGRAFTFGLADRITVRDPKPSILSLAAQHSADFRSVILEQSPHSYTRASVTSQPLDPYRYATRDQDVEQYVSFLHRNETRGSRFAMGLNTDLSGDFGALALRNRDYAQPDPRFSFNQLFTTPVLGYSSQGSSFSFGWDQNRIQHSLGLSVINDQQDNGHVSNSILYETRISEPQYHMGMQVGAMMEDGSLLGGASDSAFGVDQTTTYYLGLNGSYQLGGGITLLGGMFHGMSSIDESRNSVLGDFSGIHSTGYAVGLLIDDLLTPRGSFGISYSNPMQTTGGSATMTLPVGQNRNTGALHFESSNLDFDTGRRESIIETYYNYRLSAKSRVFAHLSYTDNPVSDLALSRNRTAYVGWEMNF